MKSVIIRNIVTEKSSRQQSGGQYSFMVANDATKVDIKKAIKEMYGVDADTVRTMLQPSKSRMIRGGYLWKKRKTQKKAVVTLKKNQTLDPNKLKDSKDKK